MLRLDHFHPKRLAEIVIFNIRWLLLPFYMRLIYNLVMLMIAFVHDGDIPQMSLIDVIGSLDVVMIANLVKMIITGSYNSFVAKDHGYRGENISSGALKIKMGSSLIGVSSVHLLKIFVADDGHISNQEFWRKIIIHLAFIVGGLMLALIDNILTKSEAIEQETETKTEHHAKVPSDTSHDLPPHELSNHIPQAPQTQVHSS